MDPYRAGCLLAAASAILFAGKGVFIRDALLAGADPTALLAVRMGISLPCFALVAWWLGRGQRSVPRGDAVAIVALGVVGYHLASWLDICGLAHIGVALERIVLYIYPTLVVGLAWALGRGRPGRTLAAAVAVTWAGVAVSCIGQPLEGSGIALGVALVAASAAAYSVHVVGIEPLVRRHGGVRVAALAMCAAGATGLVHALVQVPLAAWPAQPGELWSRGAALALVGTVAPVLLAGAALRRIGGGPSAVIGTIGPGVTVLLGWAWLGEAPTAWTWLGLALTVAGGLAVALAKPALSPGARSPACPPARSPCPPPTAPATIAGR
jgi:drug/metabolite transporter (DMT)-like permease